MGRVWRSLTCAALCVAAAGCNATQERSGARGSVGYTVTPPAGWKDITRSVEEKTGVAFDVAYGGPTVAGRQLNVNVARRDAGASPSLERLVREGRAEVDELADGKLDFTRWVRTEVDGAPALRYDFSTGDTIVRQVGTLYEGGYFVVTFTAPKPAFKRGVGTLDGMLRTWRWD